MTLELPEPANVAALEESLKSVQSEFNSKDDKHQYDYTYQTFMKK